VKHSAFNKVWNDQQQRTHINLLRVNACLSGLALLLSLLGLVLEVTTGSGGVFYSRWNPTIALLALLIGNAGVLLFERSERREAAAMDKEMARIDAALASDPAGEGAR
jgi:hypothetical protein